jgi:hypothetical protein
VTEIVIEPGHPSAVTLHDDQCYNSHQYTRCHVHSTWYVSEELHAIVASKWDTCFGDLITVRYDWAMIMKGKAEERVKTLIRQTD